MKLADRIFRHLAISLSLILFTMSASAADWSRKDKGEFQCIISTQISAFHADDGTKAFSFATPLLQKRFVNSSRFMRMVKTGYPAIYRARAFSFEGLSKELGDPTQRVIVTGPDGGQWLALYGFQKQADGSWHISAVVIAHAPGASA